MTLVLSGIALVYATMNDPQEFNGTVTNASASAPAPASATRADNWPAYGSTQGGTRYSMLSQINAQNVHDLKEAWSFRTGDMKASSASITQSPLR